MWSFVFLFSMAKWKHWMKMQWRSSSKTFRTPTLEWRWTSKKTCAWNANHSYFSTLTQRPNTLSHLCRWRRRSLFPDVWTTRETSTCCSEEHSPPETFDFRIAPTSMESFISLELKSIRNSNWLFWLLLSFACRSIISNVIKARSRVLLFNDPKMQPSIARSCPTNWVFESNKPTSRIQSDAVSKHSSEICATYAWVLFLSNIILTRVKVFYR